MSQESFQYHILVIRLWPEASSLAPSQWRLTLESPIGHERRGFTELRALLDEVEEELTRLMDEGAATFKNIAE